MASRRLVRTARAVAAVIIGSVLLLKIADENAQAAASECNSRTTENVVLQAGQTSVEFTCGTNYPTLFPNDLTKAYDKVNVEHSEAVLLDSLIHKAELKNKSGSTYTLSVNHSTVLKEDKSIYYYCQKTSRDEYCTVAVTVKAREATPATVCNAKETKKILLDKREESIRFACDSTTYTELLPSLKQAYARSDDNTVIDLNVLHPDATLKFDGDHKYTLTVPERTSSKIFYYRCKGSGADDVCQVEITVEKNKENASPTPEPVMCTSTTGQVEAKLSAQHPGVAFTCGLDVPTLVPEDLTQVYTTSTMDNAVKLSSLFPKAALYTDPTVAAYTYFLYIPYRTEDKELYYKCKDSGSKSCKVKVTVEANDDVVPVCADAAVGAYLSYEDFSENVKFKCDAEFPEIVPSDLTKVYDQDPAITSSAQAVALTTVYSGAKLVSDGDPKSPTFTLTIPAHLPRQTKHLYYQCKKAEATCTVRIRVAEKKPKMITCSNGEDQKVTITAAGEIVRFKCDEDMILYPGDEKTVYDNRDNKCSTVADLTKLVPNASLAADSEGQGKVITFTELPTSEKALCYSCASDGGPAGFSASFRAPQTSNQCRVLIDVKSAAQSLNAHTLAGHAFMLMSFAGALFSVL